MVSSSTRNPTERSVVLHRKRLGVFIALGQSFSNLNWKESLMGMENLYREVMDLNMMDDNDRKRDVAKAFFEKLNFMKMPEYFNWAAEIFEGIHVKERGEKKALIWADIVTTAKQDLHLSGIRRLRQSVSEQAAESRRRERRQHVHDGADLSGNLVCQLCLHQGRSGRPCPPPRR